MIRHALAATCLLAATITLRADLAVEKVGSFDRPVWAAVPLGVKGKLWVVEQAGQVWILDEATGERSETPFLDIRKDVSRDHNEEGLLGLAFAPDFQESGRYYVNFTDKDRHTRIVRFISEDRKTTTDTEGEVILRFQQDFGNHNGGWVGFGPDGYLYIGNGDGGSGNDPKNRAQDLESLLGKLLRIDVSGKTGYSVPEDNPFVSRKDALPEIYAYGLRNPWRCSFDKETGDFWTGDVGQGMWEEINHVSKQDLTGANFGWRFREGLVATPERGVGGQTPKDAIEPVYVYRHGSGSDQGLSVTGGYVHRGSLPELKGRYLFADFQNPRIWSFEPRRGKAHDFQDHTADLQPEGGRINLISSFAENNEGELYLLDLTGPVYKIISR